MSNETFVYDGSEVKKTGRTASKEVKRLPGRPPMIFTLIEITPVEDEAWKKWVKNEELFLIDKD